MALAPQQISSGGGFTETAPLTPGQQQTVDQLVAAGAERLPAAERPGSSTLSIPAGVPTIDAGGRVRVGPYEPTVPFQQEYGQRLEARDGAALDAEVADLQAEIVETEAAAGQSAAVAGGGSTLQAWRDVSSTFGKATRGAVGDFARGAVIEGLPAVLSGAKAAFNEVMDLIDWAGDELDKVFPMAVVWGPDGIERVSQNEMAERLGQSEDFGVRLPDGTKDKLETNTGNFIRSGSQFLVGFAGGGKVLKGWKAATATGKIGKAMAQGAIADFTAFDPHEKRLSDFLSDLAPDQRVPFLDFLAANEEDGEILGRTKNAIEGLGLGVATESMIAGLRAVRVSRQAKAAARDAAAAEGLQVDPLLPEAAAAEEAGRVVAEAEELLKPAKPAKPTLTPKIDRAARTAAPVTPEQITSATVEPNVFDLDFSTIKTPEDVQATISTMLERNAGQVDVARGGTQPWATTREKAEGVDWVASMAARRPGQAMNAAEITAYRGALNASATRLLDLARKVQADPSVAKQFAFRRQVAMHSAIQAEFMGARAEAGRALQSFQMPVGTPARQLRQIDEMLAENGGAATARELADKVLKAARKGDVAMNEVARMGGMARSRAMVKAVYTNGLLSGVGTPIVNVAGNSLALLSNVVDRFASPRVARALGDESFTEAGEAGALVAGYMGAIRDAFRLTPEEALGRINMDAVREKGAVRALAPGLDDAMPEGVVRSGREESGGLTYEDAVTSKPFSASAWRVDQDSGLGRALDVLQAAIETPSNVNALMDDFFRVVASRGELRAQAFRQAQRELRAGEITREQVQARIAEIVESPTPRMLEAAEREMRELTFTRADGEVERKINAFRQMLDSRGPVPFGTLLMPFVRTPANIMSYAMRHSPLAPFMARYTKEIAAGGARAEIAKTQWAVGTAMYAVLMDMAMNGEITGGGPGNKQQREAMMRADPDGRVNWQPYSFRVGDRWYSYERLDPLGTAMSLSADFSEIMANEDWDTGRIEQPGEIVGHIIGAMGEAFFDKTMLRSTFDTIRAITSGDAAQIEPMLKERATGLIPGSSLLRMVRRGTDEYMRETSGVLDGIKNTVPGLSEGLPPARDLWGAERTYQTGLGTVYDAVVPVRTREAGSNAIDLEILDLGVTVSMPARSITIDTDLGGERVSLRNRPDIYSDYVAFAGRPAFEQLEAVVTGNHQDSEFYFSLSDGPDGGKAEYIRDVIKAYREEAKAAVIELYGEDLQRLAAEQRRSREAARD